MAAFWSSACLLRASLVVLVRNQQRFELPQQFVGVDRLHQQRLRSLDLPFIAQRRIRREDGRGRIVGLLARRANHIVARRLDSPSAYR